MPASVKEDLKLIFRGLSNYNNLIENLICIKRILHFILQLFWIKLDSGLQNTKIAAYIGLTTIRSSIQWLIATV